MGGQLGELSFYFPFEFVVYEINSNIIQLKLIRTILTNKCFAISFLNYYHTLCDAGFSLPILWIEIKMMDDTLALIFFFIYKIGLNW